MKNKVMGKALSWVLSAAMALTMSGAIPAMTTSVYAVTNNNADGILYFANTATYATTDTISFGTKSVTDGSTTTVSALTWNILGLQAEDDSETADGVLNVALKNASKKTTWANEISTGAADGALLTGSISGTKSADKIAVTTDGTNAVTDTSTTPVTATITRDALTSGKMWLPSFNETSNLAAAKETDGVYWTRDSLSNFSASIASDNSQINKDTYKAAVTVSGTGSIKTPVAVDADNADAIYAPHANVDVTKRSKVLFAMRNSTEWNLYVPSSLEAPTVSDLKYTSSDKTVTFELGKATPEGEKLGYIITDGKDYSTADAISSYELSKATALSTKGRTLTVTSSLTLSSPTVYVYVFYYKEAAKDKTVEVSSLTCKLREVTAMLAEQNGRIPAASGR